MEELPSEEARTILGSSRLGYLGLCNDGSAYVLPMFFGFDGDDVYFQCHPGMKDEFVTGTKEACLEVAHFESQHVWESVQVFGGIEKLTINTEIEAAKNALFKVPFPPVQGNFPGGLPKREDANMYYMRLRPTRIHGRKSTIAE